MSIVEQDEYWCVRSRRQLPCLSPPTPWQLKLQLNPAIHLESKRKTHSLVTNKRRYRIIKILYRRYMPYSEYIDSPISAFRFQIQCYSSDSFWHIDRMHPAKIHASPPSNPPNINQRILPIVLMTTSLPCPMSNILLQFPLLSHISLWIFLSLPVI